MSSALSSAIRRPAFSLTLLLGVWFGLSANRIMAQNAKPDWQRWLEKSPPTPEFSAPATRAKWEKQRVKIRADLWQLLGKLPPGPTKPEVQILKREDRGDYWLEKFQFDNGAGATVPGYLFLPKKAAGKSPAILYCHWHGGQYDNGKEEMLRAEHTPQEPGPTLARRGYVVLGIDAYCFGERNGRGPGGAKERGGAGEMTASKFNLWVGRTLWGMIVRDDLMALDYLVSRPEVDANRVGVTGISMGATRTWWLLALDDRIKTGVAVACLTRYQNLIEQQSLPGHGIYYFVPGVLNHFDTEAVVALIAPRPVLFLTGDKDSASPVEGIRIIESKVRPVYKLYNRQDAYESVIYPGVGHVYLPDMWDKMTAWMDRHLKTASPKP
ncbi:MAG: prolyl oligopeptidase family serine peptidase [Verrucomicrobia bacterium]|nr:prolyl oligopeptidase family serine peptidase [Verrucomicrobiota bacterium]